MADLYVYCIPAFCLLHQMKKKMLLLVFHRPTFFFFFFFIKHFSVYFIFVPNQFFFVSGFSLYLQQIFIY